MLTKKQLRLLQCIHRTMETTGVAPTFDEMREQLKLRSKSGVHRMVLALKDKGYIDRLQNRARALEIRPRAYDVLRTTAAGQQKAPEAVNESREAVPVALTGRVTADTPMESLKHASAEVQVPTALLGSGNHYALEVAGDFMTGIGIMDGDTVIIEQREDARDGDVVAASIDGSEATLKRFFRRSGLIELHAANPDFENQLLAPQRVRILGRVCALLRKY